MVWWAQALIILVVFLLIIAAGMPIGFAFGIGMVFGALVFLGNPGMLSVIPQLFSSTLEEFVFLCLPFFVFMAEVLDAAEITKDAYDVADKWFSRIPGGLAVANVVACALFSAVCGSSAVATATMGRIAATRMQERGYDSALSTGSIASAGSLAIMIPPSLSFIVYGMLTGVSVGRLFVAGILPGILLVIIFSVYIVIRALITPSLAPSGYAKGYPWSARLASLATIWPMVVIFVAVMGAIYMGIATPTEASAIGCLLALAVAILRRRLTGKTLWAALMRTTETAGLIGLVLVGGKTFSYLFATIGLSEQIGAIISGIGLSPYLAFAGIVLIEFILGMFMEGAGLTILTVPLFFPIMTSLGFDPIWFGVIIVLCVELALITPPVGVNVYLLAGIVKPLGITMGEIFRGIWPYVVLELLAIVILTAFPQIATWLPSMMIK